ncbi:MAG TPA: FAD/NAD(P)-binding protein, partial [Vicinamibacterales bacterium]|nr:FAD/NAD(P)-binding protein [Vicinamibacterales bacterium]
MSLDRDLGVGATITRKDFLNTTLLGLGGALITAPAPATWLRAILGTPVESRGSQNGDVWTGYGGVGDYAAANGNTRPVMDAAHRLRDGTYASLPSDAADAGELYDVIVVGGGISGLTAAYTIAKTSGPTRTCLVLENHAMFGGGARRNEFEVNGVRLVGPQASNQFGVPREGSASLTNEIWTDFGLPRSFEYQALDPSLGDMSIPLDNYAHMDGVNETQVDVGYFFDDRTGASGPT